MHDPIDVKKGSGVGDGTPYKLLFLVREKFPSFRPDVTELFGCELPAAGVRVVALMTNSEKDEHLRVRRMGRCAVVVTPSVGSLRWPSGLNKLYAILLRYSVFLSLAWRGGWDIVQSRDEIVGAWLVVLATLRHKARRSFWLSFPFPEEKFDAATRARGVRRFVLELRGRLGELLLYRSGLPLMDHVFVQSEQMRNDLAAYGVGLGLMTPVPMGVQLRSGPGLRRTDKPPSRLVIGYLGTLDAARRPEFMVDVLAAVRKSVPDAELLLVGEGARPSDRLRIEERAENLDLSDCVRITGFLAREDAWAQLGRCFVCLSPFFPTKILNSTSPTKLIEYLQLGLPVVANDHPEQRQVIQASGVGICVPWSADAFAGAIVSMWGDSESAWRAAANGPDYVRQHRSYEAIGAEVYRTYKNLCKKGCPT